MVRKRLVYLFGLGLLLASFGVQLFGQKAYAALPNTLDDQIKNYKLYNSLDNCFADRIKSVVIAPSDLTGWNIFSGQIGAGAIVSGGKPDGNVDCQKMMTMAASAWGITDPLDFLLSAGWTKQTANSTFYTPPTSNAGAKFQDAAKKYLGYTPSYQNYFPYEDAMKTLAICGVTITSGAPDQTAQAQGSKSIWLVGKDGTATEATASKPNVSSMYFGPASGPFSYQTQCHDVVDYLSNKSNATSFYSSLPAALAASWTGVTANNIGSGSNGSDAPTCNPDLGLGWLLCPVMNFLGGMNDIAYGKLKDFLTVDPGILDSQYAKNAWSAFLNIGNVLFVIAFLFMIYSQLTSFGLSNYGIKKMLPRLIVVAILVNASYIICQLAVDISNVLGYGMVSLFNGFSSGIGIPEGDFSWQSVVSTVLGAGLAAVGAIALVILVITTPTVLLVLGAIILILVARQAVILLLVVAAPIALVAYLLPNTESLTKKWYQAFLALLLVFPIIGLLFGASKLAANIIFSVGGGDGTSDPILMQVTALTVEALPLIAVPALLFGALRGLGSIGAKIESYGNRSMAHATKKTKEGRVGEAMTAFNARRQVRKLNRRRGNGWVQTNKDAGGVRGAIAGTVAKTGFGTYQKRLDESPAGQYLGGNRGAAGATSALFKEFDDEVKRQKTLTSGRSNEDLLKDLESGKGSAEYQSAIAGVIMSRSHRESHLKALDIMGKRNTAAEASGDKKALDTVSSVQKQMAEDMKSKPFALGDMATGQLVNGTYGRARNHEGAAQPQFGDIQKELRDRIGTKLSASGLAGLDPDEMKRVMNAADKDLGSNDGFTKDQATSLVKAIQEARANPQVDALIKPETRAQHDEILKKFAYLVPSAATPRQAPSLGPIGSEAINPPASDGNRLDVHGGN